MAAWKKMALAGFCTALAFSPPQVQAQTMDYGALETLFGESVTTSATGKPQRASDVPLTMEIITNEQIRRSPALDIPGILRYEAGINVWQWTMMHEDVSVRGYNQVFSPRLLVLVNGRQVYDDDYGHVAWETIPVQLEEIRQIEVVKGPNSALFGFNAVGGVINIITYNPMYDDVSGAGVTVGNDAYRQGHFLHTEKHDKFGIRVSGGLTRADDYEPTAGNSYIDPQRWSTNIDGMVQLTEEMQLRIEYSQSAVETNLFSPTYILGESRHATASAKATLTAEAGDGLFQGTVYHNTQKKDGGGSFLFALDNDVTVAQAEYIFPGGKKHDFRLQGEYRHNKLEGFTLVTQGSEIFYDLYAAGGMWNWSLRPDLSWTNALRVDHLNLGRKGPLVANAIIASNDAFDQTFTEYSYNSGLVWNVTTDDTLRVMTARGIQAPSLWEMGETLVFTPVVLIGNPRMDASVITNYEIGYDRQIEPLNGHFQANLFYQETEDLKTVDSVNTVGLTSQPGNIGDSSTIGLELGLDGTIGKHWNWDTNYTLQHINDDLTVNQGGTLNIGYNGEDSTPVHTWNGHIGYTNGAWEVDGFAHYVSEYDVVNGPSTSYSTVEAGDFLSLSGRVGYNINDNVTLAFRAQELNHSAVRESSGSEKERQFFLSLTSSF